MPLLLKRYQVQCSIMVWGVAGLKYEVTGSKNMSVSFRATGVICQ